MIKDIRWHQRFDNYLSALGNLQEAVDLHESRELTKLEEQGLIKAFELVHELAWLTIKDYFDYIGETGIHGSRDAFRLAFKRGIIENGEVFMQSIKTRQLSVHTYNKETAEDIHSDILNIYFSEFKKLADTFSQLKEKL